MKTFSRSLLSVVCLMATSNAQLIVSNQSATGGNNSNLIKPFLKIENQGSTTVDLAKTTLDYLIYEDGVSASTLAVECWYVSVGACSDMTGEIGAISLQQDGTRKANFRVRLSFARGLLAPGQTLQIQWGLHEKTYQHLFSETDDWSFTSSDGLWHTTNRVTLGVTGSANSATPLLWKGVVANLPDPATSQTGDVVRDQTKGETWVFSNGTWVLLAEAGKIGPQGPQGIAGTAGATGAVGATGSQGPKGDAGMNGTADLTDLVNQIKTLQAQVAKLYDVADFTAPSIVRTSLPASPMNFVKTLTVSFLVTDNNGVGMVTINGVQASQSGNVYSLALNMESGINPVVVVARDLTGNISKDSLAITTVLHDRDGNALSFGRMPDGKIWTRQNLYTQPNPLSLKFSFNGGSGTCPHDSCAKYGRTYSWAMALDLSYACDSASCLMADSLQHQGLCPTGWHLPSVSEWKNLVKAAAAGGSDSVGMSRLMSTTDQGKWFSWSDVTCGTPSHSETVYSGTDTYGFNLLPALMSGGGSQCGAAGSTYARYWTATEYGAHNASNLTWSSSLSSSTPLKSVSSLARCVVN